MQLMPWQEAILRRYYPEETRTVPTPPTYLTLDQAARSAALEKARAVLENRTAFGSAASSADPGDIVALARFILTGEDLYEGEEDDAPSTVVNVAPGSAVWLDGAAQPPADLTAEDIKAGHAYLVLPGARSAGFGTEYVPPEGTVVTPHEDGVDYDGDVYVRGDEGDAWVLPQYLIPAA